MLEREITDAGFVPRWSIVRTLMPQSVAEHSFFVAVYANDISIAFELNRPTQLSIVRYALWHDLKDEIFTGDSPGPAKRALFQAMGPGSKERYDEQTQKWSHKVFKGFKGRSGHSHSKEVNPEVVKHVVKAADWLEAAVRMGTESQMGNRNATRHIEPNKEGCLKSLHEVYKLLGGTTPYDDVPLLPLKPIDERWRDVSNAASRLVYEAANGMSRGPWITGEDERR